MGGNIHWVCLRLRWMWKSGETTDWMGKSNSQRLIHGVTGDDTNLIKLLRGGEKNLLGKHQWGKYRVTAEAVICFTILISG